MRLVLLLSFVLSGCLAMSRMAPTSQRWHYEDIWETKDDSQYKYPADPKSTEDLPPVPKYTKIDKYKNEDEVEKEEEQENEDEVEYEDEDDYEYEYEYEDEDDYNYEYEDKNKDEDEEKLLVFNISPEKQNLIQKKLPNTAYLDVNNLKTLVTKIKPKIDESSFDVKGGVNMDRNAYKGLKTFFKRHAYPVTYYSQQSEHVQPTDQKIRIGPKTIQMNENYFKHGGMRSPRRGQPICAIGYWPDSRGRCRQILY